MSLPLSPPPTMSRYNFKQKRTLPTAFFGNTDNIQSTNNKNESDCLLSRKIKKFADNNLEGSKKSILKGATILFVDIPWLFLQAIPPTVKYIANGCKTIVAKPVGTILGTTTLPAHDHSKPPQTVTLSFTQATDKNNNPEYVIRMYRPHKNQFEEIGYIEIWDQSGGEEFKINIIDTSKANKEIKASGTLLMNLAEKLAAEKGVQSIKLSADPKPYFIDNISPRYNPTRHPAIFYKKMGYKAEDQTGQQRLKEAEKTGKIKSSQSISMKKAVNPASELHEFRFPQ